MNYLGQKDALFWTWLFIIAIATMMVGVLTWSIRAANLAVEIAFFLAIEVVMFFVAYMLCKNIARGMTSFWASFMLWLPIALFVAVIGIMLVAWLNLFSPIWAMLMAIIAIAIIVILFFTTVNFAAPKENKAVDGNVSWYAFYNLSMQNDDDASNDFNFGYNPYKKSKSAKDYDADFRERITIDPALGAATMAWVDANLGTDYLGEEYEATDRDWSKAINVAKDKFMNNQDLYNAKIIALFELLDTAKIGVSDSDKKLSDQMYMNPYTEDGVPEVVVYKTNDHVGPQLVYSLNIKDNEVKVAFRIKCGYQPTDVAEIMGITPATPQSSNSGGGSDPTPIPTPTPKPDPDPDPKYNKDKTKGTQGDIVAPNDNPGPGPDTNNGVGATSSTKDQRDNSDHMSQEKYTDKIESLEDINKTQQTGNKDKTGSKEEKAIDVPTPVTPPAQTVDGDNINDNPAGAWGGPTD